MNGGTSFILTHLLFVCTLLAGGALTALQAGVHQIVKHQPVTTAAVGNAVAVENISDAILFAWAAGGALGGAYCGIAVGLTPIVIDPKNTGKDRAFKMARAFAVSLITGLLLTPYLIHQYFTPCRWSTVFLLGGGTSAGAWMLWSCLQAVLSRFLLRAQKDGLAGVIDEAKGIKS